MTHQEVENEAGEVVDVWDELPDADAFAPTVPTADDLRRWAVESGTSLPQVAGPVPDYPEGEPGEVV